MRTFKVTRKWLEHKARLEEMFGNDADITAGVHIMDEFKKYEGHETLNIKYGDKTGGELAKDRIAGLPVAGYKPSQPPEAIAAVNVFKELEERVLRHIESLSTAGTAVDHDPRFLAIGRTEVQLAFMALNRAIFQPGRVTLPEDKFIPPDLDANSKGIDTRSYREF